MNLVCKYLLGLIPLLFFSCRMGNTRQMKVIDGKIWQDGVTIEYLNEDTVHYHNAYISLRYNSDFVARKVECVVKSITPYQQCFEEEFTFYLNKDRQVTAISAIENILYRTRVHLKDSGYYMFTIEPKEMYEGVEMVGFIIE